MKKILYIANARIPTEKAHGIAIMKMCEAFAQEGMDVELVVPMRLNPIKDDPFTYYGVERNFKITKLPVIDLVTLLGKVGFYIESLTYAISASLYCLWSTADILYGRDELVLSLASLYRKSVVWEAHTAKKRLFVHGLLKRCALLVVISKGLKEYYSSLGVPEGKVFVAPSGVDIEKFTTNISKEEARAAVGLPKDKKIVSYIGHLYAWKGVRTLAAAASDLRSGIIVVFVGGTERDLKEFKRTYKDVSNIVLVGQKAHSSIPLYLRASDVLVLPNSATEEISKSHTSPMKLFEYMASDIPVVASDVPSIREILSEQNAVLVEPDNSSALARGIQSVIDDPVAAQARAEVAWSNAKLHTWKKRTQTILERIAKHTSTTSSI